MAQGAAQESIQPASQPAAGTGSTPTPVNLLGGRCTPVEDNNTLKKDFMQTPLIRTLGLLDL